MALPEKGRFEAERFYVVIRFHTRWTLLNEVLCDPQSIDFTGPDMKIAIFALGIALFSGYVNASNELVMYEGTVIEARKGDASIKVTAGKGFDRTYEWGRCKLNSNMIARKERWFGSLGIYDPALSFGFSFGGCSGITRTVVDEGQIHFDDLQFARTWIEHYSKSFNTVWTNTGLLFSWNISPDRKQLNVNVWMVCINGRRPTHLAGATDAALEVLPNPKGESLHECAQVGKNVIDQTRSQFEDEWKRYPME